jgi:hypothetical protein
VRLTEKLGIRFPSPKSSLTRPWSSVRTSPLLGLIFADNAFLAPSLTSAARISELDIPAGYEQLPLHLKPELAKVPVFRKSVRTPYGWEISSDQQLRPS